LDIDTRIENLKKLHADALEKKHKAEARKEAAEAAKTDAVEALKETWGITTVAEAKTLIAQKHNALEALLLEAEEKLKDA
jgi:hypothetical protein